MEHWNTRILGNSSLCSLHSSHYSIIPPFHYPRFILYLFPFNRARGLGTNIIDNPVDTFHLINNPIGKMF
jgi:hypothetical protein